MQTKYNRGQQTGQITFRKPDAISSARFAGKRAKGEARLPISLHVMSEKGERPFKIGATAYQIQDGVLRKLRYGVNAR